MPIHMGEKTYQHFSQAVAAVKRKKPSILNPKAYVAAIEMKQHPPPKRK